MGLGARTSGCDPHGLIVALWCLPDPLGGIQVFKLLGKVTLEPKFPVGVLPSLNKWEKLGVAHSFPLTADELCPPII